MSFKQEEIMSSAIQQAIPRDKPIVSTMKALVFRGTGQITIEYVPIPSPALAKP